MDEIEIFVGEDEIGHWAIHLLNCHEGWVVVPLTYSED